VALLPLLRAERDRRAGFFAVAHFIAVTGYVESILRLPAVAPEQRLSFFLGLGSGLMAHATLAAAGGYLMAEAVPPAIAAALVFVTPVYFLLSLFTAAGSAAEKLALLFGFALGPLAHAVEPELDLLWAGVAGGTLAYIAGRWLKARGPA
jgi:hypothetical protein